MSGHYSDINIIRKTQGFDILMLMLMSWPSSLAHKLLQEKMRWSLGLFYAYAYTYAYVASEDRA